MREKVYHYGTMLVLLLALVIGMLGTAKADAAVPAKPSVSLTKRTKTTAAIKIKKKGKVSGYQVYMKSSKSGKYQLIMGMKTSTYTIKKLKANKTYYVKVRAFRTRGYHITFGKYSSVLKIKPYKKPERRRRQSHRTAQSRQSVRNRPWIRMHLLAQNRPLARMHLPAQTLRLFRTRLPVRRLLGHRSLRDGGWHIFGVQRKP